MIPQFLYSSTFISEEADLVCRVKYGVSITSVSWGTYGTKHCAPFCGAGRRYLQRGMELYRYGECWAVKNIFERRPKLTARTSFPCGQLDENGCLQGKGAQKESSTGCMLKVSFCGLRCVPVFRRKLRQTKKIISLTYDNKQLNRRAARYVVFVREAAGISLYFDLRSIEY